MSWLQQKTFRNKRSNGRHAPASGSIIELRQVLKVYQSAAGKFAALKGISMEIEPGEFVAVVGKSGSGKSTLLNMITGIDRPTSGEVWMNSTLISRLSENQMAVWRGKNLGIVFQFFQLLPTLTVVENVMLPMDFCHKYTVRQRRVRALELLERVDLRDQAMKLPSALSGGQQQRVAIARALANDPPILVADEPTGNLDSATAEAIFSLFLTLAEQGKTILMVTHDHDLAQRVTRTVFLRDGRIADPNEQEDFLGLPGEKVEYQRPKPDSEASLPPVEAVGVTEMKKRVVEILREKENAVKLLQREFEKASESKDATDALYEVVLEQVRALAKEAEQSGRPEVGRAYWKILIDATEPWAGKGAKKPLTNPGPDPTNSKSKRSGR